MELHLHNNHAISNVISMISLNTVIANTIENCKLGGAGFDDYDIFSPPSLKEEICFDDIMPPRYDDYNDECDIFSPPTIEEKVYYDHDLPPIYDDYNDGYDSPTLNVTNNNDFAYVESNNSFMHVNHEKNALCDSYIIEFSYDATESYYDRGKHGYINFHLRKFPIFMLKVLMLHLLCLPMLVALCSNDLFSYKIPMHRKWVRLKCV